MWSLDKTLLLSFAKFPCDIYRGNNSYLFSECAVVYPGLSANIFNNLHVKSYREKKEGFFFNLLFIKWKENFISENSRLTSLHFISLYRTREESSCRWNTSSKPLTFLPLILSWITHLNVYFFKFSWDTKEQRWGCKTDNQAKVLS